MLDPLVKIDHYLEDLSIGMAAEFGKTISEADILAFSAVSGDTNPIHLDAEYAATTRFGERIAHGILNAGLISAVLGTKLPGAGCIYISQSLRFRAPVKIGDTVRARAEIIDIIPHRRRIVMKTTCTVGGNVVTDGEAMLLVPTRG